MKIKVIKIDNIIVDELYIKLINLYMQQIEELFEKKCIYDDECEETIGKKDSQKNISSQ